MDVRPNSMTIKLLLGSKCQFDIPRFQRDYSWENNHYQEFIEDMLDCLVIDNGEITNAQYFLGTMLFIGNLDKAGQQLSVVDGQQRLTTITIVFSALSDHFKAIGNDKLSERIFDYIMAEDDDGNKVKILKSDTSYPYFQYFIQDRDKKEKRDTNTEEEECVKQAFDYLYTKTSESEIRKYLQKKYDTNQIVAISYENLLKALRDQILSSTVVTICTTDKKDANKIFEILNAKGKRLASVDLIKNKIFDILNKTEPADTADEKWNAIKSQLYSGKNTVGLSTYFRHYWRSKYSNSSEVQLYDNFIKKIKPQDADTYNALLDDLVKNAKYYSQIINPTREDYENKKQYYWLVQSLRILANDFNIVQVRTLLMSLFDARDKGILKGKDFKNLILYLEGFHFSYNALLARRANVLDSIYGNHARAIRKCNTCEEIKQELADLRVALDEKYPLYQDFKDAFIKLSFSKKDHPDNLKVRYVINKLNCYYSENGQEVFPDDGSIEHILPESSGVESLNIGNLILLERKLNENADSKDYSVKKEEDYSKSAYKWIKDFVNEHVEWKKEEIKNRAEKMADVFYNDILRK